MAKLEIKDQKQQITIALELTAKFAIPLCILVGLMVGAWYLVGSAVAEKTFDSSLLNLMGRQRMLLQRYAAQWGQYHWIQRSGSPEEAAQVTRDLQWTAELFESTHFAFMNGGSVAQSLSGDEQLEIPPLAGPIVLNHLDHVSHRWTRLKRFAPQAPQGSAQELVDHIAEIQRQAEVTINDVDHVEGIVQTYSEARLMRVTQLQSWMTAAAIALLFALLLWVHQRVSLPVVRRAKNLRLEAESREGVNKLFEIAQHSTELKQLLRDSLEMLQSISSPGLRVQGGIFSVDSENQVLHLQDCSKLPPGTQKICESVQYGQCLCGRVVESGKPEFASGLDCRHPVRFDRSKEHGHFSMPIRCSGELKGVMALHMPQGIEPSDAQMAFHGTVTRILGEAIHRLEMEENLRTARNKADAANKAKSIFLASMSHEIRTPMNGILGMTHLLQGTPLEQEQQEYANTIRASGEALLVIINDILDFSKIEAGKVSLENIEFSLRALVDETAGLMSFRSAEKGLELVASVAPSVPDLITGDPGRIRQVLINLLGNAVKFTTEGEVVLSVDTLENDGEGVLLQFSIRDTGIGISPESMERLFEAFSQADLSTTRKYGGTGLGLTISSKLAALMGGRIEVHSVPGEGSTFRFKAALQNLSGTPAYQAEPVPGLDSRLAIVVDENDTASARMAELLKSLGCKTVRNAKPDELVSVIQQSVRKAGTGALVFLTAENGGYELGAKIQALNLDPAPVQVLMTRRKTSEMQDKAIEAGFAGCLSKPVIESTFAARLGLMVGTAGSAHPGRSRRSVEAEREPDNRSIRILLAEDNLINQKVAEKLLERMGHQVQVVANGLEALEVLLSGQSFDLVLMDCHMPEMDGYEATRKIRHAGAGERNLQIPVIALTASAMPGDKELCLEAGMDDFLSKPIDPATLQATLEKWGSIVDGPPAVS